MSAATQAHPALPGTQQRAMGEQASFKGYLLPDGRVGVRNHVAVIAAMEEKYMGAVRKGGTSALMDVIGYGDAPRIRGLNFMDAPAPGVENIAALAASGAQLILFSTGVGNPIGHPLVPTIKLTGNPMTAETFADNIDVDVGGIVRGSYGLADAAAIVRQALLATASGELTCSETLGDLEISISRVDVGFLRRQALGEVF